MLKKSNISIFKMADDSGNYREEWKRARLGKITSSRMGCLCAPEGIGKGGLSYLYSRLGEELTGIAADPELDTDATRHGLLYEVDCLSKFAAVKKIEFLVTQRLICVPGSRFGSTPDALIVIRESLDKLEYEVETVESKCPPSYPKFISASLCNTPQDIKRLDPEWYWQVLSQMEEAGAIRGWLVIYNPFFKVANLTIIEFSLNQSVEVKGQKTYPLNEDIKLLRERKKQALDLFNSIRDKMIAKGYV